MGAALVLAVCGACGGLTATRSLETRSYGLEIMSLKDRVRSCARYTHTVLEKSAGLAERSHYSFCVGE